MLPNELADIMLAAPAHLRRCSIADVRVVRPNDGLRFAPMELQYVS